MMKLNLSPDVPHEQARVLGLAVVLAVSPYSR